VICGLRDCSKKLSAADDLWGSAFCHPDHRRADNAVCHQEDTVAVQADALAVIRNITTAHLVGDQARILALAFKDDEFLRARLSS
jgi:hypothetical protein